MIARARQGIEGPLLAQSGFGAPGISWCLKAQKALLEGGLNSCKSVLGLGTLSLYFIIINKDI